MKVSKNPKVVMIGGGTGSFTLLSALKNYIQDITALVNMVDSGGSSGVLRDELGALPPGDIRQCLVALSRSTDTMRELFNYRFPEGTFGGHSFGNLFLTATEQITENFGESVKLASQVLNIQGRVLPITLDDISLVYEDENGNRVVGEDQIGQLFFHKDHRPKLSLEPNANINPEARQAIIEADMVVIAPGNMYRSIIPALIVGGVREAINESAAKVVSVANLVKDAKQTSGLSVDGMVSELERFIGEGAIDYVLYNTKEPTREQLDLYAEENLVPVEYHPEESEGKHYIALGKDLISSKIHKQAENDKLIKRTLIRHDGDTVSRELMRIFYS